MSEEKNVTQYNKVEQVKPENHKEETDEVVEKEQLTQVVKAKKRKKGIFERLVVGFMDTDGEGTSVGQYLMRDIIGPAIKDLIVQSAKAGVDKIAYGRTDEVYRGPNRPSNGPVRYDQRYSHAGTQGPSERARIPRNPHQLIPFDFATRQDAMIVLDSLKQEIRAYGFTTVSDYYDLIGEPTSYTTSKYGWYELNRAVIKNNRGGFMIYFPEPEVVA